MGQQPFYHQKPYCDAGSAGLYLEHSVHEALRPFIAHIWTFDSYEEHPHVSIPDGTCNVVFAWDHKTGENLLGLSTPRSTPLKVASEGGQCVIAARFRWGAATSFWHMPPLDGNRMFVPLEELLPRARHDLRDRLLEAPSLGEKVHLLQTALLEIAPHPSSLDPNILNAVNSIQRSGGRVRADQLADWVGYSASQLRRRMVSKIGMAPKQLARVCRVWNGMALAKKERVPNWGHIAAQLDYYDQAHLVRDFKDIVGMTPTAWRATVSH